MSYTTTYFALAHINMIHVEEGYDALVLFIVQGDADLLEDQLNIKSRCFLVGFVVHDNLHTESAQLA